MAVDFARTLYEEIVTGGEETLTRLLRAPIDEFDHLDFKEIGSTPSELARRMLGPDDRDNLAIAIGGFHNGQGGVLVWGIRCSDRDSPEARATRTCVPGIADHVGLAGAMARLVGAATVPPVGGVEFHKVPLGNGKFALAMYVPPRGLGVFRSEAKLHRYYFRAGDRFAVVPHDLLMSMLGQSPPPDVVVRDSIRAEPGQQLPRADGRVVARTLVNLENHGCGMAFHAFLTTEMTLPGPLCTVEGPNGAQGFAYGEPLPGVRTAVADTTTKVPPRGMVTVGVLVVTLAEPINQRLRFDLLPGAEHTVGHKTTWEASVEHVSEVMTLARSHRLRPSEVWARLFPR